MKTISTILVPFDFSEVATNALKYAVHFIQNDPNAKIILAHVVEGDVSLETEEKLEQIVTHYSNSLTKPIVPIIAKGKIIDALLQIQSKTPVDLVIMGTCPDKSDCHLQSKTSDFVLEAQCPVIVIPTDYTKTNVKKIALIIDKEKIHNNEVLNVLLDVSRRFNAIVSVLTIVKEHGGYGYTENDEKNENDIIYHLENFYSHHAFIEDKDIVHGLFNYVEENDIDLVAILPKNHAEIPIPSQGKLTKALSQQTKVPLLAIDL